MASAPSHPGYRHIRRTIRQQAKAVLVANGMQPSTKRGNRELDAALSRLAMQPYPNLDAAAQVGQDLGQKIVDLSKAKNQTHLDAAIIRQMVLTGEIPTVTKTTQKPARSAQVTISAPPPEADQAVAPAAPAEPEPVADVTPAPTDDSPTETGVEPGQAVETTTAAVDLPVDPGAGEAEAEPEAVLEALPDADSQRVEAETAVAPELPVAEAQSDAVLEVIPDAAGESIEAEPEKVAEPVAVVEQADAEAPEATLAAAPPDVTEPEAEPEPEAPVAADPEPEAPAAPDAEADPEPNDGAIDPEPEIVASGK